jgi:acyl dehydratase|tara:strand:+ start:3730 stop:4578 length:849 start_codon:yes stop_codon:yes gene_type:complete
MAINYEEIMSLEDKGLEFSYTQRDSIIYGLGIGLGKDPMDATELKYVYENGLIAFPSMATNFQYKSPLLLKAKLNMIMIVHGEQGVTLHQPMPASADVISDTKVVNCYDRGASKGAIIEVETNVRLKKDNSPLCTLTSKTFARGDGGFGGEDVPASIPVELNDTPDIIHEVTTTEDQALIFRLSGDSNPLHSDPNFAKMAGYPKPILHGLCSYGVACRSIVETLCEKDSKKLKKFNVRFSSPVFPGETIVTEMWKKDDEIHFQSKVKERDKVVLKNGVCKIL